MPSVRFGRTRHGGVCDSEFFHPNQIQPGDIVRVTTHFPSDEMCRWFGVPAFTRTRRCQWCVIDDEVRSARRNGTGELRLRDKHGDVWRFEGDGLLHTRETAPFSIEHVMKKWGPLRPVPQNSEGNVT